MNYSRDIQSWFRCRLQFSYLQCKKTQYALHSTLPQSFVASKILNCDTKKNAFYKSRISDHFLLLVQTSLPPGELLVNVNVNSIPESHYSHMHCGKHMFLNLD